MARSPLCLISVNQRMKANHNTPKEQAHLLNAVPNISKSKNESKSQRGGQTRYTVVGCA